MNTNRVIPAVLVLLALSAAQAEDPGGEEPTELEPMVVTPPWRYESDRQLDRVARNLPEMGSHAPQRGFWRKLVEYDPNELPPEDQERLLRMMEKLDAR